MKGDRHHVYMVTFCMSCGGWGCTVSISFSSNKNGWDLNKEILGRIRNYKVDGAPHGIDPKRLGRKIQMIFDCGVTGKTHGKYTKDT
jgi:hypothetical protein